MVFTRIFSQKRCFSHACSAGGLVFIVMVVWASGTLHTRAQETLPQEALANLVKPSVVRIAEHVSGTAKIPAIKVDIRSGLVAVIPNAYTEVPVDEYLVGSGFIIHEDGYIATNAHVVSVETVKQMLASESALSALYENALFLSDAEMQDFLKSESEDSFSKKVLQYVIEHSTFDLISTVVVLRPGSEQKSISALMTDGFPATVVSVNENFLEDEKDAAIIRIEETRLPALALGSGESIAVGKRAFIIGFPATAELNQQSAVESTFTQGVVSAIKQSINRDFRVFQTDAKVSEGSSGGPLFDDSGSVVGIVTFQTDELSRVQGDNFAFALPIEMVKEAAEKAGVMPAEGLYGRYFKQGVSDVSLRHCDRAVTALTRALQESHPLFVTGEYTSSYFGRCEALRQTGMSLDTPLDEWTEKARSLGTPLLYFVGGSIFIFIVFGGLLFWILRQVNREEHEIEILETRLSADEARIKGYHSTPRGDVASHMKHPEKNKKII